MRSMHRQCSIIVCDTGPLPHTLMSSDSSLGEGGARSVFSGEPPLPGVGPALKRVTPCCRRCCCCSGLKLHGMLAAPHGCGRRKHNEVSAGGCGAMSRHVQEPHARAH